jgi:hypothetical protein
MNRLIILITGLLILSMPVQSRAAGMDIGFSTWYCWWQPSWNNEGASYRINPAFFYGPGLSFRLPANFTISSGFLYALVKTESPMGLKSTAQSKRTIQRYDSDTTISYSFTSFFKLFVGFKYTHYQFLTGMMMVMPGVPPGIIGSKDKYKYDEYAPAMGIGFTVHLIENLYLLINASILYEYSFISRKTYGVASFTPIMYTIPAEHWSVNKIGANSQLGFAYFIQKINTVITIGGRYQVYKIVRSDSDSRREQYSEYYDHFYGITASVLYRIEFGKKKGQEADEKK